MLQGSKPDSTADPYVGLAYTQSNVVGETSSRSAGAKSWTGRCQLTCRPRHLTTGQNEEVRPKIVLALLQNRGVNPLMPSVPRKGRF
ncbi:hypothetical protein AVEN_252193-1 [Araneus ventricosus]|uniref:Uncharacterized protein n=1 Tax=Araneus ventricosus TaxID=182803 RepID=A0A4Y2V830_ARAVE|nr:hypothetical protein AVEN_223628-1 [Araneus ventricosus]GBO21423.1 hypothetical protein AVEN_252193-1 [Araneus ventricosus]